MIPVCGLAHADGGSEGPRTEELSAEELKERARLEAEAAQAEREAELAALQVTGTARDGEGRRLAGCGRSWCGGVSSRFGAADCPAKAARKGHDRLGRSGLIDM